MDASRIIERVFGVGGQPIKVKTEITAGITTFLTMAYIIFVQPAVLSGSLFGSPTGIDFGAVMVATCISAAIGSFIMGMVAKYPIALAPGMGENFFFVTSVITVAASAGHHAPWKAALGATFVAGVMFIIITLLGIRRLLLETLSSSLKNGIAVGIGLFIALIGLEGARIIIPSEATGVHLNPKLNGPDQLIFFFTFTLIVVLQARGVRGAILLGIIFGAIVSSALRLSMELFPMIGNSQWVKESMLVTRFEWPSGIISMPPSLAPTFAQMDILTALTFQMLPVVFVLLFMDIFDTMGTLVGVAEQAGFIQNGKLPRAEKAFLADAIATVIGAVLGTSTVTSYIESLSGVEHGGRTGLTAVVAGLLFLVALFFSPVVSMIASYPPITAPAIVVVGAMMMRNITKIEWHEPTEAIPAFAAVVGIPFAYSISDGIGLAILLYPIVKGFGGKAKEVPLAMYIVGAFIVVYFIFIRGGIFSS